MASQRQTWLDFGFLSAISPVILVPAFASSVEANSCFGEAILVIFGAAIGLSTWFIFGAPVSVRLRMRLLIIAWAAIGAELLLLWLLPVSGTPAPPLMIDTL